MRFSLAAVFLLLPLSLRALDPGMALTHYGLASWQIEDGLPGNTINAAIQSRSGYMWFGTQEGLVRFDGVRFTMFDRQNTPGLKSNDVEALMEDNSGALWIGTYGGGITRYQDGVFTHFGREQGLSDENVSGLVEDPSGGDIRRRRSRYAAGKFTAVPAVGDTELASAAAFDSGGALWIGTKSNGLVRWRTWSSG